MDSLTHLVAGALTPLVFRGTPKRAAVVTFGIAVGELPDIDVFFGHSAEALLTLHRGITHALFWQPAFVLIAVVPFFLWLCMRPPGRAATTGIPAVHGCPAGFSPGPDGLGLFTFGRMYLVALIATATHIYLDCMTTFGTQAFLPFSEMRVGLPAMFIVDLCLTVPALVLLVMALRCPPDMVGTEKTGGMPFHSARARRLARIALAWVLLYPLISLGINTAATRALEPELAPEHTAKLSLMTEPFSPLAWKAIVDEGPRFRVGSILLTAPHRDRLVSVYDKPDKTLYARLKEQHEMFAFFESFSPLMVQSGRPAAPDVQASYTRPVTEYSFMDLRYVMSPGSIAAKAGRKDPNFVLEARVNDTGALLAYRFLQRGKDADITPWVILE